jgi:hypothetical protein
MRLRRTTAVTAAAVVALTGLGMSLDGRPGPSVTGRSEDAVHREPTAVATPPTSRRRVALCALPPGEAKLPARTVRGLAHHLYQYPALSLATTSQNGSARRLVAAIRHATRIWRDPRRAAAAGFDTRHARRPKSGSIGFLHAEHRRYSHDRRYLDARRPETLVYANVPGRPLVLIGVMFSMPRGLQGPTPGGPVTRWHWHVVCARGNGRGLTPRPDGSCPRGSRLRQGSEMMHVWFTGDLRSAFAIHAPVPDLCAAGLLPAAACR